MPTCLLMGIEPRTPAVGSDCWLLYLLSLNHIWAWYVCFRIIFGPNQSTEALTGTSLKLSNKPCSSFHLFKPISPAKPSFLFSCIFNSFVSKAYPEELEHDQPWLRPVRLFIRSSTWRCRFRFDGSDWISGFENQADELANPLFRFSLIHYRKKTRTGANVRSVFSAIRAERALNF